MKPTPVNQIDDLTFGIELETIIPIAARVAVGHYHNGNAAHSARIGRRLVQFPTFHGALWKTETDGSISVTEPLHRACEFVSPILKGEEGVKHLIEFVEFLRSIGAKVNPSCGFHVHVGAQSAAAGLDLVEYVERLTRIVCFNSKALYAQTGTIRREAGRWCKPLGADAKATIKRIKREKRVTPCAAGDRYQILNLTNLPRLGTVEFRCFAGTLNTSKVLLHVFSAIALAVIARTAKTPADWQNKTLTGEKAVTNFLKVRPMARIVGSPTFAEHFPKMLGKALEMAAKYDAMQAGLDLALLTAKNLTTPPSPAP